MTELMKILTESEICKATHNDRTFDKNNVMRF